MSTSPALINYNYESSDLSTVRLKKETNFIPAQELLDEVRNMLRKYVEMGLLDDSIFYPKLRHCLAKCGAKIYPVGDTVIPVKDYKAELPNDFHKLIIAIGCFDYTSTSTNENPNLHDVPESQIENYLISKPSYTCLDDCGENFYVIQRFETYSVTYTDYCPLSVSKNSWPKCTSGCFNKQTLAENQIELGDRYITTNFPTGWIFIEYLQNLESKDNDLLIPDYAQIREWIKGACITEAFKYLYYGGEDVERKWNQSKAEEVQLESNARLFFKMNEFKEMYDVRKMFFGRYDKFTQMVYGYNNR